MCLTTQLILVLVLFIPFEYTPREVDEAKYVKRSEI